MSEQFDWMKSYGEIRHAVERDFERRYVTALLERHSGNVTRAAQEARMDRKHLHDLGKRHGVDVEALRSAPKTRRSA